MELYDKVATEIARKLTLSHSNSFTLASRMYDPSIRAHIYNIHGWVRVGREITTIYRGHNAGDLLENFRKDTHQALGDDYSTNPIIHAFAFTANAFAIDTALIDSFLHSLSMDISPPKKYSKSLYDEYIRGSSEAVQLMNLKLITAHKEGLYEDLQSGIACLGAAFQKIDFLRNFAADRKRLGICYFPQVRNGTLTEEDKQRIIREIRHDLTHAIPALDQLPKTGRSAMMLTAKYYYELLKRLEATPAETIVETIIRVPEWRKAQIFASVKASGSLKRGTA